jgi:hypothetical protein
MIGSTPSARASALVGLGVAFVAGVDLMRALRTSLLQDPDPGWAVPRLLLGHAGTAFVAAVAGGQAGLPNVQICRPGTSPGSGRRIVERVNDGWGRTWAVVLAARPIW